MKWVIARLEDLAGIFHTYLPIKAAISLFMDACDQALLIVPKMEDPNWLTLHWRSFSRWGGEHFTFSFCNKDGQYFVFDCIEPVTPPEYQRYTTNNRWHPFSGCGRACVSIHFDDEGGQYIQNEQWRTNVDTLRITVACLNATIYVNWNRGTGDV